MQQRMRSGFRRLKLPTMPDLAYCWVRCRGTAPKAPSRARRREATWPKALILAGALKWGRDDDLVFVDPEWEELGGSVMASSRISTVRRPRTPDAPYAGCPVGRMPDRAIRHCATPPMPEPPDGRHTRWPAPWLPGGGGTAIAFRPTRAELGLNLETPRRSSARCGAVRWHRCAAARSSVWCAHATYDPGDSGATGDAVVPLDLGGDASTTNAKQTPVPGARGLHGVRYSSNS